MISMEPFRRRDTTSKRLNNASGVDFCFLVQTRRQLLPGYGAGIIVIAIQQRE
jgi:hypothetical protein